MIVQNNSTPWVILAVLIMTGCATAGMILGNVGPFNSQVVEAKIPAQQTQGALDSLATQYSMEMIQTQQVPFVQQTVMVAQMTAIPLQQTATQVALSDAIQALQANATQTVIVDAARNSQIIAQATQTSIANGLYLQNLSNSATATAIEQNQIREQVTGSIGVAIASAGLLVICCWSIARIITQISIARAKEKAAHAQLLAEQRRLAALRARIQTQKELQGQRYPVPRSLMKNPGNSKGLPRAE
jgi:anion-transporting  ArsA/GET3 family ATPase